MKFTSIEEVTNYLDAIPKFQSQGASAAKFDLSRFRKYCSTLNNPQDGFESVHVGGTNGKGSTCRILASVYEQAGYKVGLYTSPHIISYNERFQINGRHIPDELLLTFFNEHLEAIEDHELTFFEISTAVAFWLFNREDVDLAIIEVGLGGRLDATNIINPLISVITSIARDHTDILGESLEEIAREKAGIIKTETPVVTGLLPEEARRVIVARAREQNSKVSTAAALKPRYLGSGRYQIIYSKREIIFDTDLLAPVQAINIAMAWLVAEHLDNLYPVSEQQFKRGLADVRKKYANIGRFSRLLPDRRWYFDGGHNPEAVKAMKETVRTMQPVEDTVIILSLMKDKIKKELMEEFLEFKKIYYHELNTDRAATTAKVSKWLPVVNRFPAKYDQRQALFDEMKSELVIFAGSFYFYTTVRDWLNSMTNNR